MICHGLTGHGDGPRVAGTDAVEIIEHVPLHADNEYFEIVSDHDRRGDLVYSTREISDDQIWHLVNYLRVFETDQLLAETHFSQARALAEQGDFEQALLLLNQAIELSPRFVLALQGRGIISRGRGDLEQAIADHSHILMLDPGNADGYYDRAEAYRLAGRPLLAANDLQRYLDLEPQAGNRAALEQLIGQLLVSAGEATGEMMEEED
jgi:tetratricopeptide (TPR) repeat protein